MLQLDVDTSAINAIVEEFKAVAQTAVRPAAQAGAQVFYEQVRMNVMGRPYSKTGNLLGAIYQVYSQDNSRDGVATYHVSWNKKRAPHGQLVEFGYLQKYQVVFDPQTGRFRSLKNRPLAAPRQVPARPFLRPALSAEPRAVEAARRVLLRRIEERVPA